MKSFQHKTTGKPKTEGFLLLYCIHHQHSGRGSIQSSHIAPGSWEPSKPSNMNLNVCSSACEHYNTTVRRPSMEASSHKVRQTSHAILTWSCLRLLYPGHTSVEVKGQVLDPFWKSFSEQVVCQIFQTHSCFSFPDTRARPLMPVLTSWNINLIPWITGTELFPFCINGCRSRRVTLSLLFEFDDFWMVVFILIDQSHPENNPLCLVMRNWGSYFPDIPADNQLLHPVWNVLNFV